MVRATGAEICMPWTLFCFTETVFISANIGITVLALHPFHINNTSDYDIWFAPEENSYFGVKIRDVKKLHLSESNVTFCSIKSLSQKTYLSESTKYNFKLRLSIKKWELT